MSGWLSALSGFGTSTGKQLLLGSIGAKEDRQSQRRGQRHQTGEREAAEEYSAQQAAIQRDWSAGESQLDRDFQSAEAGLARAFSAQEAQRQMDFQERMSSTQVQRAAEDLQRAGLNRILALGQPSAAPSGAMAQSATPSGSRGSGTAASSSGGSSPSGPTGTGAAMMQAAIQMQTAKSLIDKQKEETKLLRATKERTEAETVKTKAQTGFQEAKSVPAEFIKEFLGGEGSTGKQIHDAIRPTIDRVRAVDSYLQQRLGRAEEVTKEGLQRLRKNMNAQRAKRQQERNR